MTIIRAIFVFFTLFAPVAFADEPTGPIEPPEAIQLAAAAAPKVVRGMFALTIQATGKDRRAVYLNSELDYRDQRCLTIEIPKKAVPAFQAKYGKDFAEYFQGKRLLVSGAAERVTVYLTIRRRPTKTYYYQTHIMVTSPEQITVTAQ